MALAVFEDDFDLHHASSPEWRAIFDLFNNAMFSHAWLFPIMAAGKTKCDWVWQRTDNKAGTVDTYRLVWNRRHFLICISN